MTVAGEVILVLNIVFAMSFTGITNSINLHNNPPRKVLLVLLSILPILRHQYEATCPKSVGGGAEI